MNDPREWAISYLAARGDVPWRWADDGEVISWADGTTIAFRGEIAFVLEWLVPHGWPSFGALVWLFAASRQKLPPRISSDRDFVLAPNNERDDDAKAAHASLAAYRSMHATVENGLAAIAHLPDELRTTLKAKAVMAETIFGQSRNDTRYASLLSAVVEVLRSGILTDAMLNDPGAPPPENRNEWLALHDGLKGITPESLALRLRTGLDELPEAPELPPIASVRVRSFLAELRDDAEHASLARLARDFMAALQLPRRLSELDEMPIGGFADLANRGTLDRLLLSELAHDDLTLAVRIALNEALYLRREPPARQPPSTLAVLIDSGVRLWGVPRVLAAAVALALIAKSARHEEPVVFRACDDQLKPVDLLTREGVVEHLGALETHAHPGAAMDAFCRVVREQERVEAVLITHRDVLQDASFQRSLAAAKFEMLFLAVVDREGGFELIRYPQGGTPICQARVNVEDLWPKPRPTVQSQVHRTPLIDREAHPELPVSFSRAPFPLLLAVRGGVQASVATGGGGGLCVMRDRRLLHWERRGRGATTLVWSLPRGKTLWLGELSDGRIVVVKAHNGCRQISCRVFRLDGSLVHSHDWRFAKAVRRVEVEGEFLFIIGLQEASIRNLGTGEQLGSLPIPRRLFHGRYFLVEGNHAPSGNRISTWSFLAWDGLELKLVPVALPTEIHGPEILRLFHRRGFEGPWAITRSGKIFSHEGRCVLRVGTLRDVVRVSENGHRLLVAESLTGFTRLVDLQTLKHHIVTGTIRDQDWDWKPAPPTYPVRVRFDQIAITDGHLLHLRARSGSWWMIFPNDGSLISEPSAQSMDAVAFEEIRLPGGLGFSVRIARWPDGRCAWLDDRGMLHLRCADRSLPELTLTLSERPGAWSSDNHWMGHDFFVGEHPRSGPEKLLERLRNFCEPTPFFPRLGP